MNKTLNDFFNAIDDGASKDELLEIIEYMDNPNDLYNAMTEVAGDHPDDVEIYNAASRKYRRLTERSGSRNGSRKGAASFATSGFDKAVKGITGTLTSKPVMNTLKRTTGTEDQRNQVILENHSKEEAKNDRQNKVNELRKGSGPLCDSGNISGKGSRPENLGKISSGIVAGRERSLHLNGEYTQESRKGSRKGSVRRDVKTIIENSVIKDGYEYDFSNTRAILESQGYSEFEIDDFIDQWMDTQWEI